MPPPSADRPMAGPPPPCADYPPWYARRIVESTYPGTQNFTSRVLSRAGRARILNLSLSSMHKKAALPIEGRAARMLR
jgi:hypothetical protein